MSSGSSRRASSSAPRSAWIFGSASVTEATHGLSRAMHRVSRRSRPSGPTAKCPSRGCTGLTRRVSRASRQPGGYVVAYETNHARTTQTAAQFDEYLSEVGLETIAAARRKRGDGVRRVREAYSRHAKALLAVGGEPTPPQDHAVGLRLELILDGSQPTRRGTDESTFRLLHLGRPLAGALVTAAALGSGSAHSAGTLRCARTGELHATPGRDLAHQRGSHGPRRSRSRRRLGESLGVARIRPACRHGAT